MFNIIFKFPFYPRHSLSKNQYQYSLSCNVEDNRRANNWSVTHSFYDNKHNAKHSYNNNNSSHLRMINEVNVRNIKFKIITSVICVLLQLLF